MLKKLFIIGQPGDVGGASTELFDQIKIWKMLDIELHIIPTEENYECQDKDIIVHPYKKWDEIDGNVCISFCNNVFLNNLREIKKYSKKTIWVNCMMHCFNQEVSSQILGLIDLHLYQTKHQFLSVSSTLKHFGKYNYKLFDSYFDYSLFEFNSLRDENNFCFGRISRSDPLKFARDQFYIYDHIKHNSKKCYVLGANSRILMLFRYPTRLKCGYDITFYKPNEISRFDFYKKIDVLCMKTNGPENYPRCGMEAMASGSVLVVNDIPGWRCLIDSDSGFLCKTKEDFINAMNYLASNPDTKKKIAESAYNKLKNQFTIEKSINSWRSVLE